MPKMTTYLVTLTKPEYSSNVQEEVEAISKEAAAAYINAKYSNPEILSISEFDTSEFEEEVQ